MADFFDWGDSEPRSDGLMPYIIRPGDYLRKIAILLGFDEKKVWNLPANESIRKRSPNPWQLVSGDLLFVPDVAATKRGIALQESNLFAGEYRKVKVNLRFKLANGKPRAKAKCTVQAIVPKGKKDGEEVFAPVTQGGQQLETKDDGSLSLDLLVFTRFVIVTFLDEGIRYRCDVGSMEPPNTLYGVMKRARNLGIVPNSMVGDWGGDWETSRDNQGQVLRYAQRSGCTSFDELTNQLKKAHGS